jgi:hypothetical protein
MIDNPVDPSWDDWREHYHFLTDAQQKHLHAYFWRLVTGNGYYSAHSFNVQAVITFLRTHRHYIKRVLEVGGGDGLLANRMLNTFDGIESWLNIEFCNEAASSGQGDSRYTTLSPAAFRWWKQGFRFKADVLILSHVLEHFTPGDIQDMLATIQCHYMYIDVPLSNEVQKWDGTPCTHVLEMTGEQLVAFIEYLGYECTCTNQYAPAGLVAWFHARDAK